LFGFIGAGAMLGQLFCSLFAASMAWLGPVRTIYLRRFSEAIYLRRFSEVDDTHIWRFSTSGVYSTKSAYEALFIGATEFGSWERIWKSWVPGKCKFFMWTVAHNQCWTADRLAKRGLKHPPKCPLCDQVGETIDHLLVSCVFSRQFWFCILQHFGLQAAAPQLDDHYFIDWWAGASSRFSGQVSVEAP